jgi:class 3 adenylate cyclase
MKVALPANETDRLRELEAFRVLDTAQEQEYDDLVYLASQICRTPIALMTLIDTDRQWWKSRIGMPGTETPRDIAFCAHAILKPDETLTVKDAREDERFANNPLVTDDPSIRFYAGAPMVTLSGHAMGTLCVIDRVPRELTDAQKRSLEALSRQAVMLLELRRAKRMAEEAHEQKSDLLKTLEIEQEKSDRLLASMFPPSIAQRLRSQPSISIAEEYPEVTILFADLTNFWRIAGSRKPVQVIELLNRVFSLFDGLVAGHGVEKVKTIGDSYMAVAGPAGTRADHAAAVAELALSMQREIGVIETDSREPLDIRIGIHSGPVIAGVIGTRKLAYDMWGPTVALANQMESCGVPGGIQVSAATYQLIKDDYLFEPRGEFYVPGSGEVTTYLLTGRSLHRSHRSNA